MLRTVTIGLATFRAVLWTTLVSGLLLSSPTHSQVVVEFSDAPLQFHPVSGEALPQLTGMGGDPSTQHWEIPVWGSGAAEPVVAISFGAHAHFSGFEIPVTLLPGECAASLSGGDAAVARTSRITFDISEGVFANAEFFDSQNLSNVCLAAPQEPTRRDFSVAAVTSTTAPFDGVALTTPTPLGTMIVSLGSTALVSNPTNAEIAVSESAAFFPTIANEVLYESGTTAAVTVQPAVLSFVATPVFKRGVFGNSSLLTFSDALSSTLYLFNAGPPPGCLDSIDANDDGVINLSDPIMVLNVVMAVGDPANLSNAPCGPDETPDALSCDVNNCGPPSAPVVQTP